MKTLIEKLAPTVDKLRKLHDSFGTRPMDCKLVAIKRWPRTSSDPKAGTVEVLYEHKLVPTPRIKDASNRLTAEILGFVETGQLIADEISLSYSLRDLLGLDWSEQENVEFFWELTQKIPATSNPMRRRYRPKQIPQSKPTTIGWSVLLIAMENDRDTDGSFLEPY